MTIATTPAVAAAAVMYAPCLRTGAAKRYGTGARDASGGVHRWNGTRRERKRRSVQEEGSSMEAEIALRDVRAAWTFHLIHPSPAPCVDCPIRGNTSFLHGLPHRPATTKPASGPGT